MRITTLELQYSFDIGVSFPGEPRNPIDLGCRYGVHWKAGRINVHAEIHKYFQRPLKRHQIWRKAPPVIERAYSFLLRSTATYIVSRHVANMLRPMPPVRPGVLNLTLPGILGEISTACQTLSCRKKQPYLLPSYTLSRRTSCTHQERYCRALNMEDI